MRTNTYDVAIVGAGVAGLMSAALLAKAGKSVVVLERADTIGGRGQTRNKNGFFFNIGAHAIYLQGAAYTISKKLGIDPAGKPPVINNAAKIYSGEQAYMFPGTPKSILSSLLWTWRDRLSFFNTIRKIMQAKLELLAEVTYEEWLLENVSSENVRGYLRANGRVGTYTNAIDLSAKHALNQFRWVLQKGVRYVDYGWGNWLATVAQQAQTNGADIRTQQRVTRIDKQAETYCVTTATDAFSVVTVILATPPAVAAKLLPTGNGVEKALSTMRPVKVAALNIALAELPNLDVCFATAVDRPLYYSLHSAAATLAPQGKHLVHLMYYLPDDHQSSPEQDRGVLEQWLDQLQPGWREHVIESEFLPRIAVVHDSPRVGHRRIDCEIELPNVYVAGDWVHSDQILADGAAQSAQVVVEKILV